MILDIHTHKIAPYPVGIISLPDIDNSLAAGQPYSVGIHPWLSTAPITEETFDKLAEVAAQPEVLAIGECGVDLMKGGPMFRQLQILKRQIELSEQLEKPLILHCVKGVDMIMGLKRDLNPKQPWLIHGFRGKPETASQLTSKGIYLSFGEKFNQETVALMPREMILAETDESVLTITEIIGSLSQAANCDLTPDIRQNVASFLGIDQ